MANISNNYPFGLSENDLKDQMKDLGKEILDSAGNINVVLQISPLIALGQTELQSRTVSELKQITEQNANASDKNAKSASKLSQWAIVLAGLAIIVPIGLQLWSNHSNENWEKRQLDLIAEQTKKIEELVSATKESQDNESIKINEVIQAIKQSSKNQSQTK